GAACRPHVCGRLHPLGRHHPARRRSHRRRGGSSPHRHPARALLGPDRSEAAQAPKRATRLRDPLRDAPTVVTGQAAPPGVSAAVLGSFSWTIARTNIAPALIAKSAKLPQKIGRAHSRLETLINLLGRSPRYAWSAA